MASAAILVAGAVALSSTLTNGLRETALEDNARDVRLYVDAVLAPNVVPGGRVVVSPRALHRLARTVRQPEDVRGMNIWSKDGRLVFSSTRPERVGKRVRPGLELRETVRNAAVEAARPASTI